MKNFFVISLVILGAVLIGGFVIILLGIIPMTTASGITQEIEVSPQTTLNLQHDAEETVRTFYTWYLDSFGDRANGDFHNPLTEKTYRKSDLLTAGFKTRADDILQSFEGGAYDPFLCAQDFVDSVSTETLSQTTETATIRVSTNFEGHQFDVNLIRDGQLWKIDNILCGSK